MDKIQELAQSLTDKSTKMVKVGKWMVAKEVYDLIVKEQKAIDHSEEHLNWIIKLHEEWSSMFNPNNISFKEWVDKEMEE